MESISTETEDKREVVRECHSAQCLLFHICTSGGFVTTSQRRSLGRLADPWYNRNVRSIAAL